MSTDLKITYYTSHIQPGSNLLASFRLELPAPWGEQSVRGDIIMGRERRERVLWPKKGEHFATTPATREETEAAERVILANWKKWRDRR